MQEYVKKFSIADVQLYREQNEDPDFATVELWALAEGNNTHRNPFSKEVLREYADTFKGKFIVAKYDNLTKDATTHVPSETIVGYVSPTDEVEFKTKEVDGIEKEFVVVKGVLSKVYATEIVEMFKSDNNRSVSCEFGCSTLYDEDECGRPIDEFGTVLDCDNPVLAYHIFGITILGKSVNPSVKATEIKVKKFMEKFAEHTVDKSKEAVDMGDWDGNKAKDDLLKEPNYITLAKDVCLVLEDGWKERRKGSLKYPVMNLKDGKWVYNAEGLSSARAYGEQHNQEVADKAIAIQKRLGLYKDSKEDKMEEEKKLSETESQDNEKNVVMEDETTEKKEMSECEEECVDKEMSENEQVDGKDVDARIDDDDDEDEEKEEVAEEEKKFSLDAYVDEAAIVELLKDETDENKELANKLVKEMSASEIVEKFMEMAKENAGLKAEKEANDKEKRDKKFSAIMASVKEDLDVKQFSELSEEGKNLSLSELGAFENKVKAFAYEASKTKANKNDDGITRFAGVDESFNQKSDEDVFVRLSKM